MLLACAETCTQTWSGGRSICTQDLFCPSQVQELQDSKQQLQESLEEALAAAAHAFTAAGTLQDQVTKQEAQLKEDKQKCAAGPVQCCCVLHGTFAHGHRHRCGKCDMLWLTVDNGQCPTLRSVFTHQQLLCAAGHRREALRCRITEEVARSTAAARESNSQLELFKMHLVSAAGCSTVCS